MRLKSAPSSISGAEVSIWAKIEAVEDQLFMIFEIKIALAVDNFFFH